ncbi:hypothetical protein E3N88_00516 [Mikania micrantha]|uniref:Pentatricopeptide repeat-containing protein n=1 Tax=Mikania micrantha TaxID=192012 RepID=A0A5N6Q105_9ASTR|nr:hypothetical protein E3N88_00516 [Mikania micrantha]
MGIGEWDGRAVFERPLADAQYRSVAQVPNNPLKGVRGYGGIRRCYKYAIELLSSSFLHVDLPSTIIVEASIATPTNKNNHRSAIHQALIVPENDCFFAIQAINSVYSDPAQLVFEPRSWFAIKNCDHTSSSDIDSSHESVKREHAAKQHRTSDSQLCVCNNSSDSGAAMGCSERCCWSLQLLLPAGTSYIAGSFFESEKDCFTVRFSVRYQKMLKSLVSKASSTHKNFQLSPFNQQEATTSLLIAIGEDMHLFNQLLNYNFQTLDYIKGCIFQMCTGFFLCKLSMETRFSGDNKLFLFAFQDLIATIGSKYQQKIQDWPPPFKNSKGRNNPEVALPMLDAILKSSLERLKLMRADLEATSKVVALWPRGHGSSRASSTNVQVECNGSFHPEAHLPCVFHSFVINFCLTKETQFLLPILNYDENFRESMPCAQNIGNYSCTMEAGYSQHVNTIRNLSLGGRLGVALWLHNKMIYSSGVIPDVVTHNHLINGFCKVGAIEKAEWLIGQMSYWGPSPNCATYNTLMKGYCAFNDIEKALDLLSTMSNDGGGNKVKPNIVTFNILVHALCKKGLSDEARVLLSKLTDENREKNLIASTILMDNYFKNGNTSLALTLWEEIYKKGKELDVVAYNVLVHGYCLNLDLIVVYKYVNEMLKIGLGPDKFTYNTLISGLCKVKRIDDARYLFYNVMSRMGVSPDMVSHNILIQGLCNVGNVVEAHELLNGMLDKSMVPKQRIWNIIIHWYGKNGDKQNALYVRDQMIAHGVSPNMFTYNALIHMFTRTGEIFEAHLLMKEMLTVGPLPDTVTYNLLVGAESEYGHLFSAHQVYDEMLQRGYHPDVVTYSELIKGYCMRGKVNEAERLFYTLYDSNLVIDHVPFQILIKTYFKLRDFDGAYGVYQKWAQISVLFSKDSNDFFFMLVSCHLCYQKCTRRVPRCSGKERRGTIKPPCGSRCAIPARVLRFR